MYFSFFNIIAFLDEETQRLNLLERKIRRPRLASSDAEEISEDLDVSHCIQTNTVTHSLMSLLASKNISCYINNSKSQHSTFDNIFHAQYL